MIKDDPALLERMLQEWRGSAGFSQISGELIGMYDRFSDDLRRKGLARCMEEGVRGMTAVDGCDLPPTRAPIAKAASNADLDPGVREQVVGALRFVEAHRESRVLPYDLALRDLDESAFRLCELYGRTCGAPPLGDLELSEIHGGQYFFEVGGKRYSYGFLVTYIHYAYCCRFLRFADVDNILEIGPGAGRQAHLIRTLHPRIKFYLVDLGPTLYLCHQYLRAHFSDSVVPFESGSDGPAVTLRKEGQIATVGNWQFDRVRPEGRTFSFNTAVFCLMHPATMERYVRRIADVAEWAYLMEPRTDLCAKIYNLPAVPSFEDYRRILEPTHALVDRSPAFRPLTVRRDFGGFDMMFWARKRARS